ncbi:hypothetical protein HOY82DRAFT_242377 [Tuber indicum]|nr:hypothetical protein HOY82DRAFT_242377 [Tuber indicum]
MPAIPCFPTKILLSQFNKRDHMQNQGGEDSDVKSPVAIVGLVITALTLLVTMIPLFRCPRFRRWVSSCSSSSFVKFCNSAQKALGVITLLNPPPTTTAEDNSNAIPAAEIPLHGQAPIHNHYSNARFVSTHPGAPPYYHNVTTREDGRVPQVEEPLGPKRPEPVVARRFS